MGHRIRRPVKQCGATYLLLLVAVALMSLVAATALSAGHSLAQRDKETELLFIGAQFRAALLSFEQSTPPGGRPRPTSLDQLLRDDRTPQPRRHLRRIFVDPISGFDEWGLVKDRRWHRRSALTGARPSDQARQVRAHIRTFSGSRSILKLDFQSLPSHPNGLILRERRIPLRIRGMP